MTRSAARAEPSTWRDAVVAWVRASNASATPRALAAVPELEAIAERFELPAALVPALALLYGAHLAGERGAAPVEVARVLGRQWDEALGRGQLAAHGLAVYADSRVQLAAPIQRVLDELPVTTGTLIGEPGAIALLGPCVVVATDASLRAVAERCLARVGGAILIGEEGSPHAELFLEARARGVAPMVRVSPREVAALGGAPAILVVADEAFAEQLGLPRLA